MILFLGSYPAEILVCEDKDTHTHTHVHTHMCRGSWQHCLKYGKVEITQVSIIGGLAIKSMIRPQTGIDSQATETMSRSGSTHTESCPCYPDK